MGATCCNLNEVNTWDNHPWLFRGNVCLSPSENLSGKSSHSDDRRVHKPSAILVFGGIRKSSNSRIRTISKRDHRYPQVPVTRKLYPQAGFCVVFWSPVSQEDEQMQKRKKKRKENEQRKATKKRSNTFSGLCLRLGFFSHRTPCGQGRIYKIESTMEMRDSSSLLLIQVLESTEQNQDAHAK